MLCCGKPLQPCATLQPYELWPTRLLSVPGDSSDKNTGEGCYFLLQGIFLTQGMHSRLLCVLHWRVNSLLLNQSYRRGLTKFQPLPSLEDKVRS